ncbi:MAG TPA: OsmC family protein [Gammaproteobacteria bacterium]
MKNEIPAGEVWVEDTSQGLTNRVLTRSHELIADEPESAGGLNKGPNPYSYLLAALGACTSMTLRLYANHKQLPLQGVRVKLRHSKVHAEDCVECNDKSSMIDHIERSIELTGDLTEAQRARMLEIANKCPVHRTLTSKIKIVSTLI